MQSTNNKIIDKCGRVILTTGGIIELIRAGKSLKNVIAEDNIEIQEYNNNPDVDDIQIYTDEMKNENPDTFDLINTSEWMTPEKYKNFDLHTFLIEKCSTQEQIDRVEYELTLYDNLDLRPLLRHLIFLVSHFRKNEILWGVGRGSSVSSFILFLIGIHKIDSMKYRLDIKEFLK